MAPKLEDNAAYKAYKLLTNRPLGVPGFSADKNDAYIVGTGELFCRLDMNGDQEKYDAELTGKPIVRLCLQDTRFSHTGNLRAHLVKGHKVKVAEVHKGASSMLEVQESCKFFEATMLTHRRHLEAKRNNVEVEDYGEDDVLQTPQKAAPRAPTIARRPFTPKKKDGTINKARMKAISNITLKCQGCRDAKEKVCPPTTRSETCLVWDSFTDDEKDEEKEEEKENSESESESGSKSGSGSDE